MFNFWKRKPKAEYVEPSASEIMNRFIRDIKARFNYHVTEAERLQALIYDAQQKLATHMAARDALNDVLTQTEIADANLLDIAA